MTVRVYDNKRHKDECGARFGSTYTKMGTMQRRLAWPLHKDDTQIREAFHIFLESIMLSETSQAARDKYDLPFNWNIINKRKKQTKYKQRH